LLDIYDIDTPLFSLTDAPVHAYMHVRGLYAYTVGAWIEGPGEARAVSGYQRATAGRGRPPTPSRPVRPDGPVLWPMTHTSSKSRSSQKRNDLPMPYADGR